MMRSVHSWCWRQFGIAVAFIATSLDEMAALSLAECKGHKSVSFFNGHYSTVWLLWVKSEH